MFPSVLSGSVAHTVSSLTPKDTDPDLDLVWLCFVTLPRTRQGAKWG